MQNKGYPDARQRGSEGAHTAPRGGGGTVHDSQLKSFVAAAQLGSFSKAAKEEHLAVQSFVQRINTLETELGCELFARTSHGVSLTAAGREFEKSAREALRILEEGRLRALSADGRSETTIRVGVPWRVFPTLQRLFVQYREIEPSVSVECCQTAQDRVLEDLDLGLFDVTFLPFTTLPVSSPVASRLIAEADFVVAAGPTSAIAEQDEVDMTDLTGKHVLCGYAKGNGAPWAEFLGRWPRDVDIVSEAISGEETIMKCLGDPNWAALFSSDTAAPACPPLIARKLKDAPPFPVGAFFRKDADSVITDFIAFIHHGYESECRRGI